MSDERSTASKSKTSRHINGLVEHFFRHEAGKLVSVLTGIFGADNIELVEDVVQDSLIEAIHQWQFKDIPDNPSAWMYRVAKNKALNIINRKKYLKRYSIETAYLLHVQLTAEPSMPQLYSDQQVLDDQLRMIFMCCHPLIGADSQIALALKTVCGFSIAEIATAFATTADTIRKRLVRARKRIKDNKISFELPAGSDLEQRLQSVLNTIYLLFNEGYSASKGQRLIRFDLCEEAIRLTELITANGVIHSKPDVNALLALMQLNTCRFKARQDDSGNIVTLENQDRSLWDTKLMVKGFANLIKAGTGDPISKFYLLAYISAFHCSAKTYEETKWESILGLYDKLAEIDPSPLVSLNRAIVLGKIQNPQAAIKELERIKNAREIKMNYLYFSALATFHADLNQYREAIPLLEKATRLAPIPSEKLLLEKKLMLCKKNL